MRPFFTGFSKRSVTDQDNSRDFHFHLNSLIFERIKLVSILLVVSYPVFFIADYFLLQDLGSIPFRLNEFAIHSASFLASAFFLLFQSKIKRFPKNIVNYTYLIFYLALGAAAAVNSQMLTGTVAVYLIILIAGSVFFQIRPFHYLFILGIIHSLFLIGLSAFGTNYHSLLTKQMYSTGAAGLSFLIVYSFYTYQKQAFQNKVKLEAREESFRRLFSMNPSPLILANMEENRILLMNRQATEYFQVPEIPVSLLDTECIFGSPLDKEEVLNRLRENESVQNYVMTYGDTPETIRWAMLNFEQIDYMEEKCVLIGLSDITSLKKKEEELHRFASVDMLTGILNRRRGIEMLEQYIDTASAENFTLCFIDINDLKTVNDRHGHIVGDEMIKTVCSIVSGKIRRDDIFFRLGGDEFVIIFAGKCPVEAAKIWDSINVEFQVFNLTGQKDFNLSASCGFYHYVPGCPISAAEMLELADKEMYKEKSVFKPITS